MSQTIPRQNLFDARNVHRTMAMLTKRERNGGVFILLLMLLSVLLETLGIGLVIPALALFTQKDIGQQYPAVGNLLTLFGNPDQKTLIIGGLTILFAVYLLKAAFLMFLSWMQNRYTFAVEERLSQQLFETYLRQPYTFHLQRNSAQLIRNITTEVEVFTKNVLTPSLQLVAESLTFLCIFTLLVFVEPAGTLNIVLVLGSASLLFVLLTRKNITRWGKARLYHDGFRMQHLQQGLGGIKDVKLLGKESYFIHEYGVHNSACSRVKRLNNTVQQMPRLWLEFLAVTGLIVLVMTMLSDGMSISAIVPNLGFFAVATFRLLPSVNRSITSIQLLQYCLPVLDIIGKDFELEPEQKQQAESATGAIEHTIELSDLTYAYPDASAPAIKRVSLTIDKGQSVGFIGPSGSGKSTLIDIVLGLLRPDKGSVRVDGADIFQNLRSWQRLIGYVPQSIYLTDNDLAHNIAFGISDELIDRDKVWASIRSANLEAFVKNLPNGLETFVGERGVRLSGGQRQRIGIARALYDDPEILVLDEATSALDSESEAAVMEAITALQGTKTVLIIAHRLTTVEHCDHIYRLEQGMIDSDGPPSEILKLHGKNATQSGKNNKAQA